MMPWPDRPLVPDDWTNDSGYHQQVSAAIAGGFSPKHLTALGSFGDDYCPSCNACWELTTYAGTIPTTGPWPPWIVTDGSPVLVSRYIT
jgi:hypothetical protein